MKNNGQRPNVTRKQIQNLIDEFKEKERAAEIEVEQADDALGQAKLAEVERQRAAAVSRGGGDLLPHGGIFFIDDFPEKQHLEYTRGRAVGQLGDIRRRLKLLERALAVTPE